MTTKPNYEIEKRDATEATIRVTIDADRVRDKIDTIYKNYAREMRVPGFRKGHVPRAYLDSRFGADVFVAEAQDELARQHLPDAFEELALRPVSSPKVETVSFEDGGPFVFTASFAVLPSVDLPAYDGIAVSVPGTKPVTDEDVDQAIEEVRSQFSTLEEKAGETVEDGDILHVREGEQEWDTRADSGHPIMKHLVGAAVGSTVVVDEQLEDRPLHAEIEVIGLRQIVLPEIDDELAKDAGYESLDALRTDLHEKMEAERARRQERVTDVRVLDQLIEKADIPLPEPFIDDLVEEEVERIKASLDRPDSSASFEEALAERKQTEDELRDEIRTSIEHRVRRELTLRAVAEAESIALDDEELATVAEAEAEEIGETPVRFVARLKAEDRWDEYRTSKINERVFARLRDAATVTLEEES